MEGRVSVILRSESGRQIAVHEVQEGMVFGESGCALGDLGISDTGLHWKQRRTDKLKGGNQGRILEIPPPVVAELLSHHRIERALMAVAMQRQRSRDSLLSFRLLNQSALTVGHVCVSPDWGTSIRSDDTVTYQGLPTAYYKITTLTEIADAAGLTINAARAGLESWEQAKYVKTIRSRQLGTQLWIAERKLLVDALVHRSSDV